MGLFDRVKDLLTNDFENYQDENEIYEDVVNEIESIENLLEYYTKDDGLLEYKEKYYDFYLELYKMKNIISLSKRKINPQANSKEYKILIDKINLLEAQYEKLLVKIKNHLLKDKEITELQKHLSELNIIIKSNARYVAFQGFVNKASWQINDLEGLRNQIADRRIEIIPYIGKLEKR